MNARFLALLLPAALSLFGQSGRSGPASNRPEAGDLAPEIIFTKVLNAPHGAPWLPANLFGQITVLGFYPDTVPPMAGVSIAAVAVNLHADKDNSGTRSIRTLASSGSTTVDNRTDFPLSQNMSADYQGIFETDANTSAPWRSQE